MTVGIIVACFLVWFWELGGSGVDYHVFRDGFYPCTVEGPCRVPFHPLPWYEGVFTGMFMHASWEHILGNLLFLWIFGNNVEDALVHVGFLFWYLAAGTQFRDRRFRGDQHGANVEVHRELEVLPIDAFDGGRTRMADMVPDEIKSAERIGDPADDLVVNGQKGIFA